MDNAHAGLLIANEGPDGSGKATQTTLLAERLMREGVDVRQYAFPSYGKDPIADLIRTMLREMKGLWNNRVFESRALLYAANRAAFRDEILGHLSERRVVLCDRYVASNQAHMGGLLADPEEWEERFAWFERLEYGLIGMPEPNIVLLHTMPSATRDALLEKREQGQQDAHEENAPYLQQVEQCYRALAMRDPARWRHVPADVDGRVQTPEEVHERVWEAVRTHGAWTAFREPVHRQEHAVAQVSS